MRQIFTETIRNTVEKLFISANYSLGQAETDLLEKAAGKEKSETAKSTMNTILSNLSAAKETNVPICQDTGMAVVFLDIGQDVHIVGEPICDAVNAGVAKAYKDGYMRASVVCDPLFDRKNTETNTPAIIHTNIVPGENIRITAVPKGFGSENKSALKMMNPTSDREEVLDFIVDTVKKAGAGACPPLLVGVGIGGTFEYAPLLAKKAIARGAGTENPDERYARLEKSALEKINALGIGPQGFGGKNTALEVNIEYFSTHIAGLPVAVNICCHVMRHESAVI